jgi:hypothetical protein
MTKDQKEHLFILIKSLSKSEKRQFKLFVNRMGSNLDSKFLNLFNLLEKSDRYDEKLILKKRNCHQTTTFKFKSAFIQTNFNKFKAQSRQ